VSKRETAVDRARREVDEARTRAHLTARELTGSNSDLAQRVLDAAKFKVLLQLVLERGSTLATLYAEEAYWKRVREEIE
jgi:hypothetical protein